MSGLRRRLRPPVRGLAVAALLFGCAALAQEPRRPGAPPAPGKTLYLVLRTGPEETEKGVLATLKQGVEKSGAKTAGEPTIRLVSPAFYEEFQALVDRAGPPAAAADGAVSIRQLPSRDAVFEIKLERAQLLKQLRVEYKEGGVKKYTPEAAGGKSPLVLTVPGRYAFTPPADATPVSCEGDVAEVGKPDTTFKQDWPRGDKFFVVTIRNFVGEQKKLFEVIQDKAQVANPLDNVALEGNLEFAFATLNSSAPLPGDDELDAESNLKLTVETVPRRSPKRVWVYFPLDEAGLKAARDSYRKFGSVELPAEVRKDRVPAGEAATIDPQTAAKWYELPAEPTPAGTDPARFTRKVKLDDVAGLAEKYPQLWMLVVWEFDTGTPEAIQVKHPKDDRVYVLERERPGWQKIVQKASKPPAPPKP